MSNNNPIVGVSRENGTVAATFSDGARKDVFDLNTAETAFLNSVMRQNFTDGWPASDDWYLDLSDETSQEEQRAMLGGKESEATDGDAEGVGEAGTQGQGQGQDGDEAEGESEGDSDGEGDDDPSDPDFSDDGEHGEDGDEPIDNPLAQNIWELIRPNVVRIAEDRTVQGVRHVYSETRWLKGGGSGSGTLDKSGGITVKVGGKVTGTVEGIRHSMFDKVLAAVARGVNVYLPGPPGTGKSHMTEQVAQGLGVPFEVVSFSQQSTESKLLGFVDATGTYRETGFRRIYENGGVMCMDELDNSNPAVVAVLNGGLANGQMAFPDRMVKRHDDAVFIATANTLGTGPTAEFAGRQKLDAATLNRFVKIFIDTDEKVEDELVAAILGWAEGEKWLKKVRHVRKAVEDLGIKHFVTMRDSLNGARLIAPGAGKFTAMEAMEVTIMGVLTPDQRDKIRAWRG